MKMADYCDWPVPPNISCSETTHASYKINNNSNVDKAACRSLEKNNGNSRSLYSECLVRVLPSVSP